MFLKITIHHVLDRFQSFWDDNRGSILPFAAMVFPVAIGMVGLGTDTGIWMAQKRQLQVAADAAAIAAAWELAQDSEENMDDAALKEAVNNGYSGGDTALQLIEESSDSSGTTIRVELQEDAQTFFSKILFREDVQVGAQARAFIAGVSDGFCILALEEIEASALTTNGAVDLIAPDCGIALNSSDDEALKINGNVDIDVNNIQIVGDYDVNGRSASLEYETLSTGVSAFDDPYEDLTIPDYEECGGTGSGTSITSNTTLSPGVYCGGLSISGNVDIEFEPGVYIIDGGDFDVTGGGSLYGEGVTFILTGSDSDYGTLDISGSKTIEFSAPLEGEEMEGVVFYQDRNAPSDGVSKLVGTANILLNGTAYFPSQELWFGGNSDTYSGDSPCTRIISRKLTLAGNPLMGNECDGVAVADVGTPSVRLIY